MNYLLIGTHKFLFKFLEDELKKDAKNKIYIISKDISKKFIESEFKVLNIDVIIASGFENLKISNISKEIRYLENYRFLIDISVKHNIKHLHINEDASFIYNGFIKPCKDYQFKENDDCFSNDLKSLNHLFIKKYIEHIALTTSLIITVSRYNKLLTADDKFIIDIYRATFENKKFNYIENNKIRGYINSEDLTSSIIKLSNLKESGIYNLPSPFEASKTELIEELKNNPFLKNLKTNPKILKIPQDYYLLDDSKFKSLK